MNEELQKLIHLFLLRRTKEQVATELPDKTEMILYCEMEKEQKAIYETTKAKYREYLLEKIEEDGLNKSKLYVLEGLLKLRQICNSPQLITGLDFSHSAVKIDLLKEHIIEKTGKHKVLIFSQFVKMLQLIEAEFDKEGIKSVFLDGKTKDRKAVVDEFQNNDDVRVFLISLKAGGTGLNLTAADYVYIVDPWWNPAVEAQAIDRCYRIGQDKHVFAYKMICKDSIEEKIIELQGRKKNISNDLIKTDEAFFKNLNKADISSLFA